MEALMKKLLVVALALGMTIPSHAEWRGDVGEWGIPGNITTEQDLERHVKARKKLLIAGIVALVAGVAMEAHSSSLDRRADRANPFAGPVFFDSNGVSRQPFNQGVAERQSNLRSQSKAFHQGAIGAAMISAICLTVAFSLRF